MGKGKRFNHNYHKLLQQELDYNYAHEYTGDPEENFITRERVEQVADVVRNVPTLRFPFLLMYEHYINARTIGDLAEEYGIEKEQIVDGIKIATIFIKSNLKSRGLLDE